LGDRFQKTEKTMKCVICREAETIPGRATLTLERDGLTLVVKQVPARVCPNCGEEYVDEDVAERILGGAEGLARIGTQVEIRQYVAA
jgi:YgiT-type zinc finger domain-containing protein